jgi:hypothetical protein
MCESTARSPDGRIPRARSRSPGRPSIGTRRGLVRDVPEDIHAGLQRRAAQLGQSLQQYLTTELRRLAERPTIDEVLERIAEHRGGRVGLQQAVADLHADRDRR